jgi:hypothetical protein
MPQLRGNEPILGLNTQQIDTLIFIKNLNIDK